MFTSLAVQSWTLYAVSTSFIFARLIFRRITLGHVKKLQADDWLMLIALSPYTVSIVLANQVGHAQSRRERRFRFVLEEMQIVTTWLVEACLLILYWRIFPIESSTLKRRSLQGLAVLCCASFVAVQLVLNLRHQPLGPQHPFSLDYTYTALSLGILNTTLIMMFPVVFIPTPRRMLLMVLLILGTLVLVTGMIPRLMVLGAIKTHNAVYLRWTTIESSLSIIFANLPFLTSLVVTATPARIRQLSLTQWPRSRRKSWESWETDGPAPGLRTSRLLSTTSILNAYDDMATKREWSVTNASDDLAKKRGWSGIARKVHKRGGGNSQGSGVGSDALCPAPRTLPIVWNEQVLKGRARSRPQSSVSPHGFPRVTFGGRELQSEKFETQDNAIEKMELSSRRSETRSQEVPLDWPIHWR